MFDACTCVCVRVRVCVYVTKQTNITRARIGVACLVFIGGSRAVLSVGVVQSKHQMHRQVWVYCNRKASPLFYAILSTVYNQFHIIP